MGAELLFVFLPLHEQTSLVQGEAVPYIIWSLELMEETAPSVY